jgi:hypothetical protein
MRQHNTLNLLLTFLQNKIHCNKLSCVIHSEWYNFFATNPKFASVEGGERGILSRRWSMCGDAFTILPKIKLFSLWFTDAYPVFFCFAAELCAEALSQDGLRQVLLRRLLYCLICEYISLLKLVALLGWLHDLISYFSDQRKQRLLQLGHSLLARKPDLAGLTHFIFYF